MAETFVSREYTPFPEIKYYDTWHEMFQFIIVRMDTLQIHWQMFVIRNNFSVFRVSILMYDLCYNTFDRDCRFLYKSSSSTPSWCPQKACCVKPLCDSRLQELPKHCVAYVRWRDIVNAYLRLVDSRRGRSWIDPTFSQRHGVATATLSTDHPTANTKMRVSNQK